MKPAAKSKMTAWFNPPQLALTGLWVASSTLFGGMFDRRELMASLDPFDEKDFLLTHDYSGKAGLWFDYVADVGDGWASTYAVARLIARPELEIGGHQTKRGKILVFGGDEIYPTPAAGYDAKLEQPYLAANLKEAAAKLDLSKSKKGLFPDEYVYAIPGNHDWYDGLTAFTHLFCARRPARNGQKGNEGHAVAGRRTRQTRSYFAVKLPGNFWLCGIDVQLEGFVDDEQIAYFNRISQTLMQPGADVIICTPDPQWAYLDPADPDTKFKNISYATDVITGAINDTRETPGATPQTARFQASTGERRHNLRLMLSGDMHLYARHIEGTAPDKCVHYIISGGGGAFTHPSNWIRPETRFLWPFRPPRPVDTPDLVRDPKETAGQSRPVMKYPRLLKRAGPLFPTQAQSRALVWGNLAFVWFNPGFGATVAVVTFLSAWLLVGIARAVNEDLVSALAQLPFWPGLRHLVLNVFFASPWPALSAVAIAGGLSVLARFDKPVKYIVGGLHAAVNLGLFLGAIVIASKYIALTAGLAGAKAWVALTVAMAAFGYFVPPTVMGIYLILMLLVFDKHRTESFSSMRIRDFKGFLRMHIDKAGTLRVFPIGLEKVPDCDCADLHPHLIEEPIVIRPSQ